MPTARVVTGMARQSRLKRLTGSTLRSDVRTPLRLVRSHAGAMPENPTRKPSVIGHIPNGHASPTNLSALQASHEGPWTRRRTKRNNRWVAGRLTGGGSEDQCSPYHMNVTRQFIDFAGLADPDSSPCYTRAIRWHHGRACQVRCL